jgi:magnesium transporter
VISVYVRSPDGQVAVTDRVDPAWLQPSSNVVLWVDIAAPTPEDGRILSEVFQFHPLSIEDAVSAIQFPKIESYPGYLYIVLHGIDVEASPEGFATRDIDFFLGPKWLVTVHDGHSRSVAHLRDVCSRHERLLAEGPVALMHRLVDAMVEHYRPVIEQIEIRIDDLEEEAVLGREQLVREMVSLRRELAVMRRVLTPQRDVIGRLARREFPSIGDEMAFRFRDVYDQVVRASEEAILFQDRVTGVLEVNLAAVSNRLNRIVQVLTVMSTIFLPLTVLTGMWGMNLPLPHLPGGDGAQFWWVVSIMVTLSVVMLAMFRRKGLL